MDCYTYPSTKTIKDVIPKDLFEKIKVHFENLNIDIELWLDKRPQFVDAALFHASTELLFPFDGSLCDGIQCSDVLDSFLLELALSQGKIVGGVETLEDRCSYIKSFPDHLGVFALNKTLNDIERKTFEKDYGLDIEDWINKYRNASFDSDDFLLRNLDYEIN